MVHTLEQAYENLKENGFKLTGQRKKMLELLYSEDKYLSAREVQELMSETYPGISPDTIYRNLNSFVEIDVLEQTELKGERIFRSNCDTHGHHHHFICINCGNTKEISECPMEQFATQLPGCQLTGHRFELYGYCEKCNSLAS